MVVPTVDWTKTNYALSEYTDAKEKTWLRRVVDVKTNTEYLESAKVTVGMRFLAFLGIRWKFHDVVDFVDHHKKDIIKQAFPKFQSAIQHYNEHCLFERSRIQQTFDAVLAKPAEGFNWLFNVTAKTPKIAEKMAELRDEHPADKTVKHIVKRFYQLEQVDMETKALSDAERLRLAVYIETKLPKIEACAKAQFFPATKGAPREVMLQGRYIFLLANAKTSQLKASGTYKKVYSATVVPFKRSAELGLAVQAQIAPQKHEIAPTQKEIAFFKELHDEPGFVKMHTFCKLQKGKGVKFRIVFEEFDGPLKKLKKPTFAQIVSVAGQVVGAMSRLHAKNIVHLDLKRENVLYKMKGEDIVTGVTDFGLSLRVEPNKEISIKTHVLSSGSYGTSFATAPEHIATELTKGTKEYFEKLDVWAAGILLYELKFGKHPSWYNLVNVDEMTSKTGKQVEKLVKRDVEKKLDVLLEKKNPTNDEKFTIVIFQMLRLDPSKRLSMQEAFDALQKITQP